MMDGRPEWCDEAAWEAAKEILIELDGQTWNDGEGGHGFHEEEAQEIIARLVVPTAALRTIQSAIPGYLKGEMSEHDFALLVLEQADSAKVNKALDGKSQPERGA
jgi:hypothetical protein